MRYQQLFNTKRIQKFKKKRNKSLKACQKIKEICIKVYKIKHKKTNSIQHKFAKVR